MTVPRIKENNPFVTGLLEPLPILSRRLPLADKEDSPGFLDALGPAFRIENTVGSALARDWSEHAPVENYDPSEDIQATPYELFGSRFALSESPEETHAIMRQVDREIADRKLIDEAGVGGFLAMLAAGALDPAYLVLMAMPAAKGVELAYRGATATRTGIKLGAWSGASEIFAEAGKHATQETRTPVDSVLAVGSAALLSGILGGTTDKIGRYVTGEQRSALEEGLRRDLSDNPSYSIGAAERVTATMDELEQIPAAKLDVGVTPLLRLSHSPSKTSRQLVNEMMETPLVTKGHVKGVSTTPEGGTVETRIKQYQALLASALEHTHGQFKAYRKRVKSEGGQALSFTEFRQEVGRASHRGDTHSIAEVGAAAGFARTKLINPMRDSAIELDLLPKDVKVTTAASYFHRVYNNRRITVDREAWEKTVRDWVRSRDPELSAPEVQGVVATISNHINNYHLGKVPYELPPNLRGPLKQRVFDIPDELIEDFLEMDVAVVWGNYVRTMAPDIELTRLYGSVDMADVFDTVSRDWKDVLDAAPPKKRKRLEKQHQDDLRDLHAIRDLLRNEQLGTADPAGMAFRMSSTARDLNYLRLFGGMVLSSIPDVARAVSINGLTRTLRGWTKLALQPTLARASMREMKKWAIGLDMSLNTRALALGQLDDVYARNTKLERGVKQLTSPFAKVALLAPWNAFWKQTTGVIATDRVLEESIKWAAGTISKNWKRRLAQAGIDESMAKRISDEFAAHGDDGVLKLPQVDRWSDLDAAQTLQAVVLRDVDRAIVTPGVSERPLLLHSELGKLASQGKTFAMSAHHKITIADLQHRDAAAFNGFLLMVAGGLASYAIKEKIAGRELSTDAAELLSESLDRSGALAVLWEASHTLDKMNIGPGSVMGVGPKSRYRYSELEEVLLGPTAGVLGGTARLIEGTADSIRGNDELDDKDVKTLRRLLPYQNVFWLRSIFDSLEETAAQELK
tara:strand:- start:42 stop:2957 length:2916 start_codon:yes stop_codon:yes gene_type:complete